MENRQKQKTVMRKRFENRGFSIGNYAKAHGIDRSILSLVLDGTLDGRRNRKESQVRKAILQLKADGIWDKPLTWENDAA